MPLPQATRYTNHLASLRILLDKLTQHGFRPHIPASHFIDDSTFTVTGRHNTLRHTPCSGEHIPSRGLRQGNVISPAHYRGFYFAELEHRREWDRLGLAVAQLRAHLPVARSPIPSPIQPLVGLQFKGDTSTAHISPETPSFHLAQPPITQRDPKALKSMAH